MARNDFITRHLDEHYDTCLRRARRQRTRHHWASYPALADRSVEDAADIVADAHHPDHNAVAAALIAAHRDRPGTPTDTEAVLLLVAARPLVLLLDPGDRHRDSRASLWASVAGRLAVLIPSDVAASPVPFLVALLGRIRPDAAKHPSEPRRTAITDAALERLLGRSPNPDHDVAAVAIARVYLAAIRRDHGCDDLTRYALYGRAGGVHQFRVARHRRRIAEAIGYVA